MRLASCLRFHRTRPALTMFFSMSCGVCNALAFAPFDFFIATWIALAGLYWLLLCVAKMKHGFYVGWIYGFSLHATSMYWLLYSITLYTNMPLAVALLLTCVAFTLLGLHAGLAGLLFVYCKNKFADAHKWYLPILFACVFVLQEWLQTLHPIAVPIALQGYTGWHLLSGLYPLVGTLGVSFILLLISTLIVHIMHTPSNRRAKIIALVSIVFVIGISAMGTKNTTWTDVHMQQPISVTMLQPNLSLSQHWQTNYARESFALLSQQSMEYANSDVIIWPENVIGLLLHEAQEDIQALVAQLNQTSNTSIVGGLIRTTTNSDKRKRYHNSLIAFPSTKEQGAEDEEVIIYDKQNMVPFGEYIPFPKVVIPLLDWLSFPYSTLTYNKNNQLSSFALAGAHFIPLICYDVDYFDFVRTQVNQVHSPSVILTVADESWFGESIAQSLRLRMHQIRAREAGRWLLRATGSGITSVITPLGTINASSPAFVTTALTATIYPATGSTPYMRFGFVALVLLLLVCSLFVFCLTRACARYGR